MFTARALTLGDKLVECRSLQNGLSSPRYQLFHCSGSHLGRANSYRPWTTSEHDRYDELIQQGWTRRRIATALDRSPGSIKYHSEKPQVPPKSSWRHWSQAEDERLLQADGAGKRLMQIVEMFPDRTRWAVQARRTMLKSGPSDATPSRSGCVPAAWNHEEDILLLRLYEEKLSPKAIAARLNKEPHQVRSRIALIRTAAPIKKNKRWSEQDHHKLLSLKAEGRTYAYMASALGRTVAAIESRLQDTKVDARLARATSTHRTRLWSAEETRLLTEMKIRGASWSEIDAAIPDRALPSLRRRWRVESLRRSVQKTEGLG